MFYQKIIIYYFLEQDNFEETKTGDIASLPESCKSYRDLNDFL